MADLPALEKTWYTRGNIDYPSVGSAAAVWRSFCFNLKLALCDQAVSGTASTSTGARSASSIWSVVSSSDSTSSAASDLWGTNYVPSKITQAAYNSPHSWIILQNDNLQYQMLIDLNTATDGRGRISFTTMSAPFVGVSTSSPAAPTRAFILGSQTNTDSTNNNILGSTTATSHYLHLSIDNDGYFTVLASKNGDQFFHTWLVFTSCSNWGIIGNNSANAASPGVPSSPYASYVVCRDKGNTLPSNIGYADFYRGGASYFYNATDALTSKFNASDVWVVEYQAPLTVFGKITDSYVISYNVSYRGASVPSTASQQWVVAGAYPATLIPFIDVNPTLASNPNLSTASIDFIDNDYYTFSQNDFTIFATPTPYLLSGSGAHPSPFQIL